MFVPVAATNFIVPENPCQTILEMWIYLHVLSEESSSILTYPPIKLVGGFFYKFFCFLFKACLTCIKLDIIWPVWCRMDEINLRMIYHLALLSLLQIWDTHAQRTN